MYAEAKTIGSVLGGEKQYVIPVFQRSYSWDSQNWAVLLEDIRRIMLEGPAAATHFLGTIVANLLPPLQDGCERLEVVDGQQRLITFSILFAVLRDLAFEQEEESLGRFITEETLTRPHARGFATYRVLPRLRDRHDFFTLISESEKGMTGPQGEAYLFFKKKLESWLTHGVEDINGELRPVPLNLLARTLYIKFNAALVRLEDENPFQVYQTLNNEGRPLTQADLIRNHLFRNIDHAEQDAVDQTYWLPIDSALIDAHSDQTPFDLDRFFSYALSRHGDHIELGAVFEQFAQQFPQENLDPVRCAQLFGRLAKWQAIIIGRQAHENQQIEAALARYRFTGYETASPLLMLVLDRLDKGQDGVDESRALIDTTSSLLVRRYFTGADSRSYYRWFRMAAGLLHLKGARAAIEHLAARPMPDNQQFLQSVAHYHMARNRARAMREFLCCVEHHLRRQSEPLDMRQATLEHIRPKHDLYQPDRDNDGSGETNAAEDRWVYSMGNLTLVSQSLNEEMAHRPYTKKRDLLRRSAFELNGYFEKNNVKAWDNQAIQARALWLAQHAVMIWPCPKRSASMS